MPGHRMSRLKAANLISMTIMPSGPKRFAMMPMKSVSQTIKPGIAPAKIGRFRPF